MCCGDEAHKDYMVIIVIHLCMYACMRDSEFVVIAALMMMGSDFFLVMLWVDSMFCFCWWTMTMVA